MRIADFTPPDETNASASARDRARARRLRRAPRNTPETRPETGIAGTEPDPRRTSKIPDGRAPR